MDKSRVYRILFNRSLGVDMKFKVTLTELANEIGGKTSKSKIRNILDSLKAANIITIDGKTTIRGHINRWVGFDVNKYSDYDIELMMVLEQMSQMAERDICVISKSAIYDTFAVSENAFLLCLADMEKMSIGTVLMDTESDISFLIYYRSKGILSAYRQDVNLIGDKYDDDGNKLELSSIMDAVAIGEVAATNSTNSALAISDDLARLDEAMEYVGENIYNVVLKQRSLSEFVDKKEFEVDRLRVVIQDLRDERDKLSANVSYLRASNDKYRFDISTLQNRINDLK